MLRGERCQASTDDLKKRRSPVQNCTHFLLRHDRECFVHSRSVPARSTNSACPRAFAAVCISSTCCGRRSIVGIHDEGDQAGLHK